MGLVRSFFNLDSGQLTTIGTGLMVRQDAVLTAAHNLFVDPKDSPKVKHTMNAGVVEFCLRYDEGKSKKIVKVADYKVPKEWSIGKDSAFDFAVLFLDSSELAPKIKLASIERDMQLPIPTRVAGYPKEIANNAGIRVNNEPLSSYAHSGDLKEVSTCRKFLSYNCFTEEGMSGGPILVRDLPISVGVHTTGRFDLNRGVHYTDHMIGYLQKWFTEREENNNKDEVMKVISELANSDSEKEYLVSKIDKLSAYPTESLRSHVSVILDMYRQ